MLESTASYLKSHPGYVSGEEISRQLGLSRAAIWKHIGELRQKGYRIDASTRQGYKLVSSPDKLFPWEVQAGLGTGIFGQKVYYHETLLSTMDEAARLAARGDPEGTIVFAETQTKGRGRMGRTWNSPKGAGLYFSVIFRPGLGLAEVARLTLVAAVAVCQALRQVSGVDARIKWPNDILLNGQKVAGILTELQAEMDRVKFVIMGIGVNVNTPSRQLPSTAVSLKTATGRRVGRVAMAQEILRAIESWYGIFLEKGFGPVAQEWKAHTMMIGQKVIFSDGKNTFAGEAVDLADDGGLMIRLANGEVIKKMAGDVVLAAGQPDAP